ncbi:cytosolic endo-beta-N-acetylglucosaminidase-like [Dorcoceras hygrometricum]|uniref:Cytosolic endo-beta-N-acetylglucosaminidase-like n=1 Tax=Dorcoceras hygrometricum TaxID=472368 RepID=A0A2Z7BB17_9LAMI|nr:cytosolic endo-beta-N-acetylglucosaminidase-like [Dorcoceras hygrometricum]
MSGKRILSGTTQKIVALMRNRSTKPTALDGRVRFGIISMGMGSGGAVRGVTSNESMARFLEFGKNYSCSEYPPRQNKFLLFSFFYMIPTSRRGQGGPSTSRDDLEQYDFVKFTAFYISNLEFEFTIRKSILCDVTEKLFIKVLKKFEFTW